MNFIKTTVIGGLVFLVPVVVIALILAQAIEVMLIVAEPMADILPVESIGGIALANIIAGFNLVLLCFVAGLIARTGPAKRIVDSVETALAQSIPGYSLIRGFTSALSPENTAQMQPVLVSRGHTSRIGLEVERANDGSCTIYFPGSPNPWSGIVEIVSAEQVRPIDQSISAVFAHAEGLGRGSRELLGG